MLDSKVRLPAAVLTAMTMAALGGGVAQASEGAPKINARPHSVMVNSNTTLKGRGFPANATLQLQECGFTSWLAPNDPCLPDTVTVATDSRGRFQTSFKVGLCPEGKPTKEPTQRVCYVGELQTGEDTGSLVGAARLIVTYP